MSNEFLETNNSFFDTVSTHVEFGSGKLNQISEFLPDAKKALIVTTNGKSVKGNGYLDTLIENLNKKGIEYVVFDEIEPNPLNTTIDKGADVAKEEKCDIIIAIGGGSAMDASKAIALVANNPGKLWDYVQFGKGGKKTPQNKALPLVAIPTTAGTGSEADMGAVVSNNETKEKTAIFGQDLFPVLSIIDPELMVSVPEKYTAFQGFDAISHSLEGYINGIVNMYSDMYALEAVRNVHDYLPKAVNNGNDLEAREKVAFGSYLSGLVMSVGNTSSLHSLEHALSAYHHDLPHGLGLILLSKAYFKFLINKHVCDDRFIKLAKVMGIEDAEDPMDFITALDKFHKDIKVDGYKMSDYGVSPDEFEAMAHTAFDSMGILFTVDRYECTVEDVVKIYEESFE